MGMQHVFEPFYSFGALVSNPAGAALTRVLQAVSIKVDEKGTEAASATFAGGVIGGISSGPKPEPFQMIIDRPFFFAIGDNETQTILYTGVINDPSPLPSTR
jgi:serpin B